jgi:hypothetical protein
MEDTMKYLFLLNRTQDSLPEPGTREAAELLAGYNEVTAAMAAAKVLVDCAPLQPQSATTTVRVRDGETLITDGPSAEIKEQLGGYTIVECADLDEALRWAASIPAAREASVEVRPAATIPARV